MGEKVAITREKDRYTSVLASLELIKDEIKFVRGKKVLIKPNFVSVYNQLAATHVDTVRAIIDFLQEFNPREIIVAESAALGDTFTGFKNYGYLQLKRDYGIELLDLGDDGWEEVFILDKKFNPIKVEISKLALEADFRVSPAVMKTHDTVIVTLSIKNIVVGSMKDKGKIHQGYSSTNLNIFILGRKLMPHLAIIDGWEGMEGDGPVSGDRVESRLIVSSIDAVKADSIATYLMGFDPFQVGYLFFFHRFGYKINLNEIETVGLRPEKARLKFKPHSSFEKQIKWRVDEKILEKVFEWIKNEDQ